MTFDHGLQQLRALDAYRIALADFIAAGQVEVWTRGDDADHIAGKIRRNRQREVLPMQITTRLHMERELTFLSGYLAIAETRRAKLLRRRRAEKQ